jgi:hypothetical protein
MDQSKRGEGQHKGQAHEADLQAPFIGNSPTVAEESFPLSRFRGAIRLSTLLGELLVSRPVRLVVITLIGRVEIFLGSF